MPSSPVAAPWHTLTAQETARTLGVDIASGLTQRDAADRLLRFGPNEIESERRPSAAAILASQFKSLIVLLLLAAGTISFSLGETLEACSILIVIIINAGFGFTMEWRAERSLAALKRQLVPTAEVIREGEGRRVATSTLVPGDVVLLQAGDKIPADGRILEAARTQVEESALTGESIAVGKRIDPIAERNIPIGDRRNMGFMGTTVVHGRARMIVTDTGAGTEIGKIGALLQRTTRPVTQLEQRITALGKVLVVAVLGICAIVVLIGWINGIAFLRMLEVGVSLAIAAVPEGLPAVVTMTLALGMQRMARRAVLVRNLSAIESLGSITTICVDKTGTLTKNEMEVQSLLIEGQEIDFSSGGSKLVQMVQQSSRLQFALRIAALCNDARIEHTEHGPRIVGDPTEAALLAAADRGGLPSGELHREYPRVDEIPFSSETKRMITVHRTPGGALIAFMKGSPGTLLESCTEHLADRCSEPLTNVTRDHFVHANRRLAERSLRVLGLAFRNLHEHYRPEDLEKDFVFVGLVGMMDPLRPTAKEAIDRCRTAGIRPIMITGDQPATAAAIGKILGIQRGANGEEFGTVHARELENRPEAELRGLAKSTSIFARVSPEHKLQIVSALQAGGEVVSMTGDGVNDAPALKQADIGIAMGGSGSDVAKETADIIITDDDFGSIVAAVNEGRRIHANIAKFIHYLFSCNLSEILTVFVAVLVGWPLPLTGLQILWLNIVTDVFPALALALEPAAPDLMTRDPRRGDRAFISKGLYGLVLWQGALLAGATLCAFAIGLARYGAEGGVSSAATIAFLTLGFAQIFHVFSVRSQRRSAFSVGLFRNSWLWVAAGFCLALQLVAVSLPSIQKVLHTVTPSGRDWLIIAGCSVLPVAVIEIGKAVRRLKKL